MLSSSLKRMRIPPLASQNSAKVWQNSRLIVAMGRSVVVGLQKKEMLRIAHLFQQRNKFIYLLLLLSIDEDDETNQSSIAERRDEIANHIIVSPQLHSHHHHHRHLWTVPWTRRVAMSKKTLAGKLEEQKPMKFPTFIGTWPYCVSELLLRLFGRYEMQPGLNWPDHPPSTCSNPLSLFRDPRI